MHGVFRGHIWCFVGTDGIVGEQESVAYAYTKSWEATEVVDLFSSINGFIQCDGYAGYSHEIEDNDHGESRVVVPDDRRLGCGMHIRSKFHDALLAKDGRAAIALKHFADLYAIEEDCKNRLLCPERRLTERQQRSIPILDALDEWVDSIHPKLLPKSPLRRATTYAINQRAFFRRCFTDGRFEIDNGRTERRIRPYATARRGFLFTGSVRGGERLAIAFSAPSPNSRRQTGSLRRQRSSEWSRPETSCGSVLSRCLAVVAIACGIVTHHATVVRRRSIRDLPPSGHLLGASVKHRGGPAASRYKLLQLKDSHRRTP